MIFWVGLLCFLIPLVWLISDRRAQNRKLEVKRRRIRRRLEEIEREKRDMEEVTHEDM